MINVFSYGSNGTAQLRARISNPTLTSVPAKLPGFSRIFCLESKGWGGGGVASLHPCSSTITYGSLVQLTALEVEKLDAFEGGYDKHSIKAIEKREDDEILVDAICYIAKNNTFRQPTEQYLTAIHIMLREHWDMNGETIDIRAADGDTVAATKASWSHPSSAGLTLPALVVEANARRSSPWTMPKTIGEIVEKLAGVNVLTTSAFTGALVHAEGTAALNRMIEASGRSPFSAETLRIFGELLDLQEIDRGATSMMPTFIYGNSTSTTVKVRVATILPSSSSSSSSPLNSELLFVYGSLMEGLHNHHHLSGAEFLGSAVSSGSDYVMVDSGASYPFCLRAEAATERKSQSGTRLIGELYRVSKGMLEGPCDKLESHPTVYRREKIDVRLGDGGSELAWAYLLVSSEHLEKARAGGYKEVTPFGDWRSFYSNINQP
jgi:gamma-glutamylcyclotransferase (GGCT)/AIG2-like uncharacterized protein YtfP